MSESIKEFSAQLRQVLQKTSPHIESLRTQYPLHHPDMSISDVSTYAIHHVDTLAVIPSKLLRSRDMIQKVRASGRGNEEELAGFLYTDPQLVERVALQTLENFKVKMAALPEEVPATAPQGQLLPELAALLPIAEEAIALCKQYIAEYPELKSRETDSRGIEQLR